MPYEFGTHMHDGLIDLHDFRRTSGDGRCLVIEFFRLHLVTQEKSQRSPLIRIRHIIVDLAPGFLLLLRNQNEIESS